MTEATRSVFSTIDEALEDIRAGKIVIVVDDADRENEGDFIMAAEKATPERLNFMVTHGRGIVCLPATAQRLDELRIPLMISKNMAGLFRAAMILVLAGALYRFDTFLVAFDPGPGWHYFPSVQELLISIGLVSIELALYMVIVKRFPIIGGAQPHEA